LPPQARFLRPVVVTPHGSGVEEFALMNEAGMSEMEHAATVIKDGRLVDAR